MVEATCIYSITSSAVARNASAMVNPIVFGGLEVDNQFEFGGLLHGQVRKFCVPKLNDAAGIDAELAISIHDIRPVAHQTAGLDVVTLHITSLAACGILPLEQLDAPSVQERDGREVKVNSMSRRKNDADL